MPSSGKPPLEDRVCLPKLNDEDHNIQVTFHSFFQVKASIGFHIFSVVISTIGAAVSSVYWQMYKEADACETITKGDCVCFKDTCKHSFVVFEVVLSLRHYTGITFQLKIIIFLTFEILN